MRREFVKERSVEVEPSTWDHVPDVLKVKDLQEILKIGRNQAYDLAASGQFYIIKIGRKMLIPKPGFIEWLEGKR
ncbi:hypothetical protein BSK57_05530 [Paenibacillus odorifer]|nr:hypothetical protein BSK57_05530 [Paenibacillus odorifer]